MVIKTQSYHGNRVGANYFSNSSPDSTEKFLPQGNHLGESHIKHFRTFGVFDAVRKADILSSPEPLPTIEVLDSVRLGNFIQAVLTLVVSFFPPAGVALPVTDPYMSRMGMVLERSPCPRDGVSSTGFRAALRVFSLIVALSFVLPRCGSNGVVVLAVAASNSLLNETRGS